MKETPANRDCTEILRAVIIIQGYVHLRYYFLTSILEKTVSKA